MNARHRRTVRAIFEDPLRSDVAWSDVESLFQALGAALSEGHGSRLRVSLNGIDAVFHRPHPRPETDKGALKAVRRFLREAGFDSSEAERPNG
ncbi:MAG: type II toxin-antitoxin system HicA family toxin [Methylorubrum rhodinum]|uniref:type II toxin-antitoxin system HicA family toxin n=1 Tax=Methylorubrum rhodinum TaxID=29428 RepID=UPI003BB1D75A